ncbi:MAG: CHRD domain-containing protein [Bryobacteraceae bacterium]|nr:CHRD domain-containing protein [Bryobacteraceae bacterium]
MKTHLGIALVLLTLPAAPLTAAPFTYYTSLSGPAEAPPNASPGTGWGFVTIDSEANTMRVQAIFSGLIGLVSVAHIHVINGPNDGNTSDTAGPVATRTPTFLGFPSGVTAGNYDATFDTLDASTYNNPSWINGSAALNPNLTPVEAAELELFEGIREGRAYLNIHSNVFPGGEIRGFLQPVPEPGTAWLALGALALAGLRKLRR